MRAWILVLALALHGCGYHLVGLGEQALDTRLAGSLNLVIDDPLGRQARLVNEALRGRDLIGTRYNLEVLEFKLERRTLSELTDSTDYELRATLTYGLRVDNQPYLIGPETLTRDGLLTLQDSNSDSLDSELESLRRDELFRDLINQMLERINAAADQLP